MHYRRPNQAENYLISSGLHALVIGAVFAFSLFHGCSRSSDAVNVPIELMIEIPDFGQKEPDLKPAPQPDPEPEVAKPPDPEPEPPPDDEAVVVEPVKPKPESRKPDIKKEEPKKPKIEVSKVKVRRPLPAPTSNRRSKLTPEEIARALQLGAKPGKHSTLSDDDVRRILSTGMKFGDGKAADRDLVYFEMVRQILYRSWDQPGSIGVVGLTTRVELTVAPDGSILGSRVVGASGNPVMDSSVIQAVRSVSRLNGVPADFLSSHRRITVAFELTGGG